MLHIYIYIYIYIYDISRLRVKQVCHDARTAECEIKMDLQEVGCGGMDWIDLGYGCDRWQVLVNGVMKLRVPQI